MNSSDKISFIKAPTLQSKINYINLGVLFVGFIFSLFFIYSANIALKNLVINDQMVEGATIMHSIDNELFSHFDKIKVLAKIERIQNTIEFNDPVNVGPYVFKYESDFGPWNALALLGNNGDVVFSDLKIDSKTLNELYNTTIRYGSHYEFYIDASNKRSMLFSKAVYSFSDNKKLTGVVIGQMPWIIIEDILSGYSVDSLRLLSEKGQVLTEYNYSPRLPRNVIFTKTTQTGHYEFLGNNWTLELYNFGNTKLEVLQNVIGKLNFLAALVVILLSVILNILLVKSIVIPVKKISLASKNLAEGNYHPVNVDSNDEVGDLAHNFNAMASRIQNSYNELLQKVQERTAELQEAKTALEKQVKQRTLELEKAKATLEQKVKERTEELEETVKDLETLNSAMTGREIRMSELKEELARLKGVKVEEIDSIEQII